MELLLSGLAAALFVAASHNAIRVVPAAFYALAAGLDALYAVGLCFGLPSFAWSVVLFAVQRCQLAVMLFAIVMFAGALSKNSSLRRAIAPIRGELSLVATILAASHVGYHVSMWVQQAGVTGALPATRMAAFAVAAVLTVLLAVLALTSVKATA